MVAQATAPRCYSDTVGSGPLLIQPSQHYERNGIGADYVETLFR